MDSSGFGSWEATLFLPPLRIIKVFVLSLLVSIDDSNLVLNREAP